MPYRHTTARIHEIVKAPKALVAEQSLSPKKHENHDLSFEPFVSIFRIFTIR
jgi:hypothetical protein